MYLYIIHSRTRVPLVLFLIMCVCVSCVCNLERVCSLFREMDCVCGDLLPLEMREETRAWKRDATKRIVKESVVVVVVARTSE